MRNQTGGAILHPGIENAVISAALIKEIKRTIAEHAVELLRPARLVTREVFAIRIAEKSIAVLHGFHSRF